MVIAKTDEKVLLSCSYTGTVYDLYWYRQSPGSTPQFLIMESSGVIIHATPQVPGIEMVNKKNIKHVELEIFSTSVEHSAVYYCAVQPTVKENTLTQYKNLSNPQSDRDRRQIHCMWNHFLTLPSIDKNRLYSYLYKLINLSIHTFSNISQVLYEEKPTNFQ